MTSRQPPATPASERPNDAAGSFVLLLIQILLGIALIFLLLVLPLLGVIFGTSSGEESEGLSTTETTALGLFISTLIFQFIQGSYPAISTVRRNSSMERDWRFSFSLPEDIGLGLAYAFGCLVVSQLVTFGVASAVGLDNTDDAANTDILTDNQGSIWIAGIIALVVIGAPLAEELLFRGYLLRTIERYLGTIVAVVGSSIFFAIPHWQPGSTWQEASVLLAALGGVGLVLAIAAVKTNRLGPPIIAHAIFNGVGTVATLL